MRFGLIHRIMTDALAVLGLLALITSGELNPWITGFVLVGLAGALTVPERFQDHPVMRKLSVIAPLGLFVTQGTRLFMGGGLLELAVEFAAGLQVVRLATRRGAAHDQQVIVLALLHLIAGTVLGGGLSYGLCFLGFLIVAPGALVLSHLRREVEGNYRQGARDRTGLPVDVPRILRSRRVIGRPFLIFTCMLSIPIFVFTALLFVLFPRVGLSLLLLGHSRPERMVGFSEKVDLGGVGKLRTDPTIVMRVDHSDLPPEPPPRLALYLRGAAFDRYDGRSWSRSLPSPNLRAEQHGNAVRILRSPDPVRDRRMRIDLEPIEPPVLFLPPDAVAVTVISQGNALVGSTPQIFLGQEGGFSYKSPDERGIRYYVSLAGPGDPPPPPLSAEDRLRYLSLPKLSPAVAELARSWVGDATDPRQQAKLIEARLRKEYRYDLDSPSGGAKDPLEDFLLRSKRGHCEFYSTAMAVMLRTLGVPTRNVTGFIGGTYNRFARYYAVRQGDAHSWVEVYLDGQGWTRFDPTPPADAAPQSEITGVLAFVRDFVEAAAQRWNRHVVGYDLKQQVGLLRSVRQKYSSLRTRPDVVGKALSAPRRTLGVIALGVTAVVAIYFWRKRRPAPDGKKTPPDEHEIRAREAVGLFQALDAAMIARGIPRPSSTPPLAHAQALAELGHPAGKEILALTERYIQARFGGIPLSEDERRDFARRVRAIRQTRERTERAAA